jgi:hypothetical protein
MPRSARRVTAYPGPVPVLPSPQRSVSPCVCAVCRVGVLLLSSIASIPRPRVGKQRDGAVPEIPTMSEQMTLSLDAGMTTRFSSLKEVIAAGTYQRGVVAVAGKIDRQPSHLSEALSGSDRRKFCVDDLELYIDKTGDTTPILYLVAKYLRDPTAAQAEAVAQLTEITRMLPALLAAAGLPTRGRK